MVEVDAKANSALAKATNQANAILVQLHDEFALARTTFQEQLLQDLNISTGKAQSFLEKLVRSMEIAVQGAISKIASATTSIEIDTARLTDVSANDLTYIQEGMSNV